MNDGSPQSSELPTLTGRPFQFRIAHIGYLVTLLSSSFATFGRIGLLPAVFIGLFWLAVYTSANRPDTFRQLCRVTLFLLVILSCVWPLYTDGRRPSRRHACLNNIKQISSALHNYHAAHASFPPAYIADRDGNPMHSWRVLLLPYVDEKPLYKKYDFSEPWNGPNNIRLLNNIPNVYRCPSCIPNTCTSYVAVVGSGTAWPNDSALALGDCADGSSNTVHLIEHNRSQIPWLQPTDLSLEQARLVLTTADPETAGLHESESFFYRLFVGRGVAFMDGSTRSFDQDVRWHDWLKLFGTNNGTPSTSIDDYPLTIARQHKLEACIRLTFFITVVLFPLPWVYIKPRGR